MTPTATQSYLPGEVVTLSARVYGTVHTSVLLGSGPTSGQYAVHTVRLADGSTFRTEGRLTRPESDPG